MKMLFIIILILFVLLWGIKEYYQLSRNLSPQSAPSVVTESLSEFLRASDRWNNTKPHNADGQYRIFIINSGWGHLFYNLADMCPQWLVIGIEANPIVWFVSQNMSIFKKPRNLRLYLRGIEYWPREDRPDAIFVNLSKKNLGLIKGKLEKALKADIPIVVYDKTYTSWKAVKTMEFSTAKDLYFYDKSSLTKA